MQPVARGCLVTGRYQQRFGFEQQVSSGAFPERREARLGDGSLASLQGEAEFLRAGGQSLLVTTGADFQRELVAEHAETNVLIRALGIKPE